MNNYEALEIVINLAIGADTLVTQEQDSDKHRLQNAALDKVIELQQKQG